MKKLIFVIALMLSPLILFGQHKYFKDVTIKNTASPNTVVLTPTSTGKVDTTETADASEITYDTLTFDFGDITNDLDIGDTLEFDNGAKIYNTHADTAYIEEVSVMIKGELNIKDLASDNTVFLTPDSNGDIDTVEVYYTFVGSAGVAGTADAITLDFTPDYPALSAGAEVVFVAEANNTGATTLTIDGGDTKNVYEGHDISALEANDIRNGMVVKLIYDGTQWQQISQSGN